MQVHGSFLLRRHAQQIQPAVVFLHEVFAFVVVGRFERMEQQLRGHAIFNFLLHGVISFLKSSLILLDILYNARKRKSYKKYGYNNYNTVYIKYQLKKY